MKWKTLTRKLYKISCTGSKKGLTRKHVQISFSRKEIKIIRKLQGISCPETGKSLLVKL